MYICHSTTLIPFRQTIQHQKTKPCSWVSQEKNYQRLFLSNPFNAHTRTTPSPYATTLSLSHSILTLLTPLPTRKITLIQPQNPLNLLPLAPRSEDIRIPAREHREDRVFVPLSGSSTINLSSGAAIQKPRNLRTVIHPRRADIHCINLVPVRGVDVHVRFP